MGITLLKIASNPPDLEHWSHIAWISGNLLVAAITTNVVNRDYYSIMK